MRKAVYVRIGFISKFILKKEPVIGFSIVLAILHKYRKRLNRILAYDVLLQGGEGMKPMKRPDIDDLLYVAAACPCALQQQIIIKRKLRWRFSTAVKVKRIAPKRGAAFELRHKSRSFCK